MAPDRGNSGIDVEIADEAYGRRGKIEGQPVDTVPKGYRRTDEDLAQDVEVELKRNVLTARRPIEVTTDDGVVRLRGIVDNEEMKQAAGRIAHEVVGVRAVLNELEFGEGTEAYNRAETRQSSPPRG